jgi:AraC family transcriptional regulator
MPTVAIRRNRYSPGERHQRHAHGYTNISLVLSGALVERVGTAEEYAGPLSVVVKPADTEHIDEFGPSGATLLQLRVPDEWNASFGRDVHPTRHWRWVRSLSTARWMLRIARRGENTSAGADDALAECLGAIDDSSRLSAGRAPDWLRHVRERIADECASQIRVSELAREAGVHPVYLTREFRRVYGTSVMGCIHQDRVRRAADALAGGIAPISHVALGAGFTDQPHLTRIFKRETGVTPAVFRGTLAG